MQKCKGNRSFKDANIPSHFTDASSSEQTPNLEESSDLGDHPPNEPPSSRNRECRNVKHCYRNLNKISEGTYGTVYRAQNKQSGAIVALKHVKFVSVLWEEGFPMAALREISILTELSHPNIVDVTEVLVGDTPSHVYMAMEYVEHELKTLLQKKKLQFSVSEKKELLFQLLSAIHYIHSKWVIHRDLKSSNLLYSNSGLLKLCDFGMARKFGDPGRPYTRDVVTQWYRAPELLLGERNYTTAVDIWSAGCIFAEIYSGLPLFPVATETEALRSIFQRCGTPNNEVAWKQFKKFPRMNKFGLSFSPCANTWRSLFPDKDANGNAPDNHLSDLGLDLLKRMLDLNPNTRISASEALQHRYFQEKPLARGVQWMPTLPETNNNNRVRSSSSKV